MLENIPREPLCPDERLSPEKSRYMSIHRESVFLSIQMASFDAIAGKIYIYAYVIIQHYVSLDPGGPTSITILPQKTLASPTLKKDTVLTAIPRGGTFLLQ